MNRPENLTMRIHGDKDVPLVRDSKIIPWKSVDWPMHLHNINNIAEEIPLKPSPSERAKSFYGKAKVYLYKDQYVTTRLLKSYSTYVAVHVDDHSLGRAFFRLCGNIWSQTTTRHIHSFLRLVSMEVPVDRILYENFKKGGYANRMEQAGDIVIMADKNSWDNTPCAWEGWYENA